MKDGLSSQTQSLITLRTNHQPQFVVMGAYLRTDSKLDPLERIHLTFEEIGISITLTTLTSTLAFGLGCLASVPAVYWLCLYAFPTILFVYLYQITFFVAAIDMDEKRIMENRRDACMCCAKKVERSEETATEAAPSIIERFIDWYASFLLRPFVKIGVLVPFSALLGLCAWSTTKLKQDFDVQDGKMRDCWYFSWCLATIADVSFVIEHYSDAR